MRTIRTKVYTFDELNEDAKQTAIENYRTADNDYSFEHENLREDFIYQISEKGFNNPDVQFSLSYCQGDGLSFSADGYDGLLDLIKKYLGPGKEKTALLIYDHTYLTIKGNTGRYCYARESDVSIIIEDYNNRPNVFELLEKVLEDVQILYMDLCSQLENQGYEHYEYLDSDEYIAETLIENDYEFLENGTIY